MPVAIPIALAAAGGAAKAIGANQQLQADKGKYGAINSIFQGLTPSTQALYASAIGNLQQGYDQAIGQANQFGATAKTGLETQGQQAYSDLSESAMNKGLGSSSYLQSLQHGIGLGTAKAKLGIDENKAMLIGNLLKEKGIGVSQLLGGQAGLQAQIGENYAGTLAGQKAPSSAGQWGALGGGLTSIGQSFLAGMGGGGGFGGGGFDESQASMHQY